ncbi:tRNA (adenosine(37)-N6)-threonylcarbamoyltransferase complex transferase subunit TsaD [Pelagibacteraceae bacterium]|nr:tRNA (adenosine(37)-N6)-threonylcarbamoyltransferase complex transferase subunit TsaD [Pelagibacteraceae bacterium]
MYENNMLVFAAETSCDETSVCLMEDKRIIDHIVFSQEIHKVYGGVVPELASRSHLEKLQEISQKIFKKNEIKTENIDVFTSTCGPGLIGSLLVGSTYTKSLALSVGKPFVPMNHLEGHVLSTSFNNYILYPNLILLLTGGHTQIYLMQSSDEIRLLGESVDDAIGEAFDKTAKLLGFDYPGGLEIEKRAINGDEDFFILPMPLTKERNFNFSFSGIKTYINLLTKKNKVDDIFKNNLSASFQKTVSNIIITKIKTGLMILNEEGIKTNSISVVGGVSNNKYIRKKIEDFIDKKNIELYYPLKEMMSDNAAMIAWACIKNYSKEKNDIYFKPKPRMNINEKL